MVVQVLGLMGVQWGGMGCFISTGNSDAANGEDLIGATIASEQASELASLLNAQAVRPGSSKCMIASTMSLLLAFRAATAFALEH